MMRTFFIVILLTAVAHAEPDSLRVTGKAPYYGETLALADTLGTFSIPKYEHQSIMFVGTDSIGAILEIKTNGDVVWRGRKVTTDKGLTDALRDVIVNLQCSQCAYKKQKGTK